MSVALHLVHYFPSVGTGDWVVGKFGIEDEVYFDVGLAAENENEMDDEMSATENLHQVHANDAIGALLVDE